ncbi:MAG: hypothetical protein RSB06_02550, partial [Clostridia bacterium]
LPVSDHEHACASPFSSNDPPSDCPAFCFKRLPHAIHLYYARFPLSKTMVTTTISTIYMGVRDLVY